MKTIIRLWGHVESQFVIVAVLFLLLSWPIVTDGIFDPFETFTFFYTLWFLVLIPQMFISWKLSKNEDDTSSQ